MVISDIFTSRPIMSDHTDFLLTTDHIKKTKYDYAYIIAF